MYDTSGAIVESDSYDRWVARMTTTLVFMGGALSMGALLALLSTAF